MAKPRIVVVGSSNTDMAIYVPTLPAPGETVLGGEFLMAAGGKGANQALAAARAGGEVTFVACVGDDVFGEKAVAGLKSEGVNTEHVSVVRGCPSGVALIMVDNRGENLISAAPGANAKLDPAHVERAKDAIAGADGLLVQFEVPLDSVARALDIARENGVLTVLNPAPAKELPRELLDRVDVLVPNRTEIAGILGRLEADDIAEATAGLRTCGVKHVIVTLGSEGALIVSEHEERVPAFEVKAVDAVAAGDVFCGAFAVAYTEGKNLAGAVRFACAAAAISVTRRGAQPSVPKRDEIDSFLAEHC